MQNKLLLLAAVVCLGIGAVLALRVGWWSVVTPEVSSPARTANMDGSTVALVREPVAVSGVTPVQRVVVAASTPVDGLADRQGALPSSDGASAPLDSEAVLSTFYGQDSPDVEGLRRLVARLADGASLDPSTLTQDADTGAWTGRINLPAIDSSAAISFDDASMKVDLDQACPEQPYAGRQLTIEIALDRGRLEGTDANVQHWVDYRRSDVLDALENNPTPSGWGYSVSRADGTSLQPIISGAHREPSGTLALVVAPVSAGVHDAPGLPTASVDAWTFDFGPWEGWSAVHESALAEIK